MADYGSPPYHESGFKAVLRRLASGAGPILMGLGTPVRPGAGFLETLGASGATSYRAASAAQQAAQEYAMKQQQMEDERQQREISQAYTQALTKQLEKPPKPEKLEPWQLPPDQRKAYLEFKAQETKATAKPETATPKIPEDVSWIDNLIQETTTGNKYINGSELHGKDLSAALRQGAKLGIPVVGSADVSQINDIEAARRNIEGIRGDLSSLIPKDATARLAAYPGIRLSTLLQTNAQRAAFATWRGSAIRNFRAVAGSKGLRLNQKEIDLAVKNDIPQLTDTYEVANQKLNNIIKQLDNAEGPIIGKKQGKPTAPQLIKPKWTYDPSTDKMVPAR